MAIALVQHTNINGASAASQALAYVSNVAVNNLLVVVARCGGTPTSITVTDSRGNTWTNCTFHAVVGIGGLQISYAVSKDSGPCTVTVTPSATNTNRIAIYEYSGAAASAPLDAENNTQTGTSTTPAANSITPAADNELVFGAVANGNNITPQAFTAGTNFTEEDQVGASPKFTLGIEDWIQTTATATTAPQTMTTSDSWMAAIAVFKAATSGAISGSSSGHAMVGSTLKGSGALSGIATGQATDSSTLKGTGALGGATTGHSTDSGTLKGSGALAGIVAGHSTVTALLTAKGILIGAVTGHATVLLALPPSSSVVGRGVRFGFGMSIGRSR